MNEQEYDAYCALIERWKGEARSNADMAWDQRGDRSYGPDIEDVRDAFRDNVIDSMNEAKVSDEVIVREALHAFDVRWNSYAFAAVGV